MPELQLLNGKSKFDTLLPVTVGSISAGNPLICGQEPTLKKKLGDAVQTARFLIIGTVTTLAIGLGAAPAAAAPTGDTVTTFTIVAASGLDIVVVGTANVGSGAPLAATSGALGDVTVTDGRALLVAAWTASVISGDFTTGGGTPAETIDAANVEYWSGEDATPVGGGTFTPGQELAADAEPIDGVTEAYSYDGVGSSSATWNPTLIITPGATAVAGVYTGTVTHSVA